MTQASMPSPSAPFSAEPAGAGGLVPRAAVILAAGKSRRMQSSLSKVLHMVGGQPMINWVAAQARGAGVQMQVCVVNDSSESVRDAALGLDMQIAVQAPQLGTGHAVLCAREALGDFDGHVAILCADAPLIQPETINRVFQALEAGAGVAVLGFHAADPGAYGRLVTEGDRLLEIVEAKDASPAQLAIDLCNSGLIAAPAVHLFSALERVSNDNAQGEYYLTDIIHILRRDGLKASVVLADEREVLGVNSRQDLAMAEQAFQARMRRECMAKGVTLRDPQTTYFSYDTQIAPDAEIGANVVLGPGVTIAQGAIIHPFSHLEGVTVGEHVSVGPFARLRPGTVLEAGSRVGNFVETKKAVVGKGSKINHLSYIGDATLGTNVNIGAGTITCNYDGYFKHMTQIEDDAFIGTNSSLVAPITIGRGAFLGSGGVITRNVPADALALARAQQSHKEGWAARYHAVQRRKKNKSE